ncbi:MAG TPA: glycosyltransferase family 87 protein [Ktedonobacteraceae bacterium]
MAEKKQLTENTFISYAIDVAVIGLMGILLVIGSYWQYNKTYADAAKYQCYTVAFWQGTAAVQEELPANQCSFMNSEPLTKDHIVQKMEKYHFPQFMIQFVAQQPTNTPFHALPHEYPFLVLLIFSLALFVPTALFQVGFAFWMWIVAAVVYLALRFWRSQMAALIFALFLVTGAWSTALARFDLVPAAVTFAAVVWAMQKRWNLAYIFLALATLLKFYPAILLIPFFIALQMQLDKRIKWYAWQRWAPVALFVLVCVVGMVASLLLNVEGTLGQFTYFQDRPVQAESLDASIMWIWSVLTHNPLLYAYTFGSLNVTNHLRLMSVLGLTGDALLVVGLLYTFWLQWRGKIDLMMASLLTLLVVIITGKVFSPQYLIWVAPLVAYVGAKSFKGIVSWSIIGLLTTIIFPYFYIAQPSILQVPYQPGFFPLVTVRNILLVGFVLAVFIYCSRLQPVPSVEAVPVPVSPQETVRSHV